MSIWLGQWTVLCDPFLQAKMGHREPSPLTRPNTHHKKGTSKMISHLACPILQPEGGRVVLRTKPKIK